MTNPKIQLLRGSTSLRTAYTPSIGEPVWDTDEDKLYIGDGSTAGGIEVGDGGALRLNDLTDVDTDTLGSGAGKILYHDGISAYQPVPLTLVALSSSAGFGSLSDVDMSTNAPVDEDMTRFDGSDWIPVTRREYFPIAQFLYNNGGLTIGTTGAGSDVNLHTEDFEDTGFTHAASSASVQCDFDGVISFFAAGRYQITSGTRSWVRMYPQIDTGGGFGNITVPDGLAYCRSGAGDDGASAWCGGFLSVSDGDIIKWKVLNTDATTTCTLSDDQFLAAFRRIG